VSFDIVTIGSATVDYFADTDSELVSIDTRVSSEKLLAFPLGGKLLIKEMNTSTGGGGTNASVAFARLGMATAFLGKLGDDVLGDFILKELAREKVAFIGARQGQTGVSFVLNSIRNDRTILTHKGSNNNLQRTEIPAFDAPWIYLSSMLERSWDTVLEFLATRRCSLAFNPSTYQAALGYDKLRAVLEKATVLVMNREEACMVLGIDPRRRTYMNELLGNLAKVAGQIVAITDGSNGAWVCQDDVMLSAKPQPHIKIVETTGAGDAFAATLTACHMRGMTLDQSLHHAMTNAESVLQYKGAKEKLLSWDELLASAARHPRDIHKHIRETGPVTSREDTP
jgi:ribokinase